jgi:hypothetical protein
MAVGVGFCLRCAFAGVLFFFVTDVGSTAGVNVVGDSLGSRLVLLIVENPSAF